MIRTLLQRLLLVCVCSTACAWPAAGADAAQTAGSWAPDSCDRPPRAREPFRTLLRKRQFLAAADTAKALRDRWSGRAGVDSVTMACLLLDHVMLGLHRQESAPALEADLARAVRVARRSPGQDSLFLARALYVEAEWHRLSTHFDVADSLLHLTLALQERRLGVVHSDVAATLFGIATARQQRGRASGMPYIERALRIQEALYGPSDLGTAIARYQFAGQLLNNGEVSRARVEGERAVTVIRRAFGEAHPDLPRYARSLAVLALNDGDLPGARRHYEESLALTLGQPRVDTLALSRAHSGIAELRNDVGDFEGALEAARAAVQLQRGRMANTDPRLAQAYVQLGRALAALGEPEAANAALDSAFALPGVDSTLTSYGVLARASAVRAAGDTAAAIAWAQRARMLGRTAHEPLDAYQAEAARFHAECLIDAGRAGEVVRELGEALDAASARYGAAHPAVTRMREAHARALAAVHDARAPAAALAVAAQRRADLLAMARGFSEREALFVSRRDGAGLDALLAMAADGRLDAAQRAHALTAVSSSRGLLLEAMSARSRELRQAASPAAAAALDSLSAARAEYARSMVRVASAALPSDSALRVSRMAVQRGELRLADLAAGFAPAIECSTSALLAALARDEALVSFALYRSLGHGEPERRRMLAFVARPTGDVVVQALGDAAAIEALVLRWRRAAQPGGTLRAARAVGDSLRRRVWDPLLPALAGAARVVIVPEGALHLVDLAALPARGGGWLIESGPALARLSAERDLLMEPSAAPAGTAPLVIGAPDFEHAGGEALAAATFRGAAAGCARFAEVRFEPLPGARAEAESIVVRLSRRGLRPRSLTGAAASEAALKREAGSASVLHLATHAFFLGEACGAASGSRGVGRWVPAQRSRAAAKRMPSAVRRDVYLPERVGVALEHPLRLAGLALAGANQRAGAAAGSEDGILTSEEIAALDLASVREVVLSGCDTGTGDIAVGEGVFGLQRAFRMAGAGSLVMSLWPVRDTDARDWMEAYYQARGAAPAAAEAVRAAARSRLAALRAARADEHPSRWAGFIAVGD